MKLRLPLLLAAAVMATFVSVPVYSATLPSGYNPIDLRTPAELSVLNNTVDTGLLLYDKYTYEYVRNDSTATDPFYSRPYSLYFTSAAGQSAVEMSFIGGYTKAFSQVPSLTFTDMSYLKFSSMHSGAIASVGGEGDLNSRLTLTGIADKQTGNWDVEFLNNSITGNCGGAIDADFSNVCIENNGGVRFSGNNALVGTVSSENQPQNPDQGSSSTGGSIEGSVGHSYTLNLFGYKFSFEFGFGFGFSYEHDEPQPPTTDPTPEPETTIDICGGAINLVNSTLSMKGNDDVTFTFNSAVDFGGAIAASPGINSTIEISNNGLVYFAENMATGHILNDHVSGGGGGAIFIGSQGSLVMDKNTGDIIFKDNLAAAAGGAIYYGGQSFQNTGNSLALTNNFGNISFEGNTAGGTGGAIYLNQGGRLIMAGNEGTISFEHNKAGVSGGAISAHEAFVTIEHNTGDVIFRDNLVFHQGVNGSDTDSFASYYVGGAIYGTNIQIHNNASVLFQRNAEIADDRSFRLRSLYVEGSSEHSEVSLSAGKGQTIEFRDSIRINSSNLHLNSDYANRKQEGDIIFTGETTEEDLKLVKKAWYGEEAEITVTAQEIEESRTSVVMGETYLNGGRLRVEHGAIYKSINIFLNENSNSTLRLYDAKLVNIGYDGYVNSGSFVRVGKGTTLEILGHSTIEGGKLIFNDGAKWSFELNHTHESWQNNAAALTFDGQLNINGSLTLVLDLKGSDMMHRYKLYDGSYESYKKIQDLWNAGNITVVGTGDAIGATFEDLVWENGNLYYESSMVWNNGQNTGEWDSSDKNWQNGKNFTDGMHVKFTNTGAGTVTLTEELVAGSIKVSNDKGYDYTFTAQADAEGEGGKLTYMAELEKSGEGSLTIDLANDYTGTTKLLEGTLNLHDDKALGNSTLTTAEGTTLGVGDNANVVLDGDGHVIKGDVVVDKNSSLEIAGGSYKAPTSTVDGKLIFSDHAIDGGTLTGSGTLEVTNGANVKFTDASNFTGSVKVNNGGSFTLNLLDGIARVGEIAVKAGELTVQGLEAANQLTMAGGSILSMVAGEVSERVTTVVADKVLQLAQDAILSAMLASMLDKDADGDDILNEAVGGVIAAPGLTLEAGSTLRLDNCFIGLKPGSTLTLNVTPEDIEKIHLELSLDDMVTQNSEALLFDGVGTMNFVFDDAIIGSNGSYECLASHYFTGDMVGENTRLVFQEGALYLTDLVNATVPEPTTATLSLLALAAIAARRRRK